MLFVFQLQGQSIHHARLLSLEAI